MKSKYKIGWIGLRVSRLGQSANRLHRDGWVKTGHAALNNRNGFDWIRPVRTREQFQETDWMDFAAHGLEAIAVWFSDAQWGMIAGITDNQWRDRRIIEFNQSEKRNT
jgi:hypothetical protein